MYKELFDRVNSLYNKNKTSLKHLRGRHDQRDHAWNRGMGGRSGGYAPGYMNQTEFQALKKNLQAQIEAGEITQEYGEAIWTTAQRLMQEDYDRANPRTGDELSRREDVVSQLQAKRNRNISNQQITRAPTSSAFISDAASSVMLANQITDYGSGFLSRLSGNQPFRPGFTQEQYEAFGVKTDGTNTDMGIKIKANGAREALGTSFMVATGRMQWMLPILKSSDPTRNNDNNSEEQSNGDMMIERLSQILSDAGIMNFFEVAGQQFDYPSAEQNLLDQALVVQENLVKYNDILQNLKIEDLTDSLGENEKAYFDQLLKTHRNYASTMSLVFGADYIQSVIDYHQNTTTLDFNTISNTGVPSRGFNQNWREGTDTIFPFVSEASPEDAAKITLALSVLQKTDTDMFYPSDDFVEAAYGIFLSNPSTREALERSVQVINENDNTSRNIDDISSLREPLKNVFGEVWDNVYDNTFKSFYKQINELKQQYPANSPQLAQAVSAVMTDMLNQIASVTAGDAGKIIERIFKDNFSTIDAASADVTDTFAWLSKSIFDSRLGPDVQAEAQGVIRKFISSGPLSEGQLRDLNLSQANLWMQNLRERGLEGTQQWNDATIAYDNAQWANQIAGRYFSSDTYGRLIELDERLIDGSFINESYRRQLIEEQSALVRELTDTQRDERTVRLQLNSTNRVYTNEVAAGVPPSVASRNMFDAVLSDPDVHSRVVQFWREASTQNLQRVEFVENLFTERKIQDTQTEIWGEEVPSSVGLDTPVTPDNTTFSSDAYAFGQPINNPMKNNHLMSPDNPKENPLFNPRTARGQARTDIAAKDAEPRGLITDSNDRSNIALALKKRGLSLEKIDAIMKLLNDSIIPGPRDSAAYAIDFDTQQGSAKEGTVPMSYTVNVDSMYQRTKIVIAFENGTDKTNQGFRAGYDTRGHVEIKIPEDTNFPIEIDTYVGWTGIKPTLEIGTNDIDNPYVGSSQAFLMHAVDGVRALAYEMDTSQVALRASAAWIGRKDKGEATGVTTWPTLGGTVKVPIDNTVLSTLAEMGFSKSFVQQIAAMGEDFPSYLFFLNAPPRFRGESGITKSTPRQLWQEFFYKALRAESMTVTLNPATPNDPGRLFNPFLPSKRSKEFILTQLKGILTRLKSYIR